MASVAKPSGVYISPESLHMNSVEVAGSLVEHLRAVGSDQVVYEWDWASGSWKSFQQ